MKRTYFLAILLFIAALSACQETTENHPKAVENAEALKKSILANIKAPTIFDHRILLSDLGGKGDSTFDNKPIFDQAMQRCKDDGGCRLVVAAGTYIINGPIHLVSNCTLDLQEGATLLFGQNPSDYLPMVLTSWEGTFLYNYSPLIYAAEVENVAIIGQGTIDGNGKGGFSEWHGRQKESQMRSRKMNLEETPFQERLFGNGHYLRPQLIQFYKSKNILLEGISIHNSPFWCVHFLQSENITARKMKFDAHNKNNDGFDPEYSKNILIEDIEFNNGDDNVAIKAGRDHEGRKTGISSENILVRNCQFKGLHGVVIGSEMSAGVQRVVVENCHASDYCKRGIYLKSNPDRGGFIRDVYIKNIAFSQVEDLLFITSYYHGEGKGFETDIHDIHIDSVSCTTATHAGLVIQGYPTKKVHDIYLSNIKIDSCRTAMSLTNTEQIVLHDVVIGEEVSIPSAVH